MVDLSSSLYPISIDNRNLQVALQKEVVLHHEKDGLRGGFGSLSGPGRGHDVEARAGGLGMGKPITLVSPMKITA